MVWLLLVALTLVISFILALRSMSNYLHLPQNMAKNYSLYLVKNPKNISIDKFAGSSFFSMEKLFKGGNNALVIFIDKEGARNFKAADVLELEDYTKAAWGEGVKVISWVLGVKPGLTTRSAVWPSLSGGEQLWLQLTAMPAGKGKFKAILRLICLYNDPGRLEELQLEVEQTLKDMGLLQVPVPLKNQDILKQFVARALPETTWSSNLTEGELNNLFFNLTG